MQLGNYTSFTQVSISIGHDANEVENYQRSLSLRTGVGSVRYTIGDTHYTREYFVSYPNDLMVVRYTSDGDPLNLIIQQSTQHKTKLQHGYRSRSLLVGETPMVRDNMLIHVLRNGTRDGVRVTDDGILTVRNGTDVILYIAGYEALKQAHMNDISALIDPCRLDLDFKPVL